MEITGIQYEQLLKNTRIYPGDKIRLMIRSDKGTRLGAITAKVTEVHRHHVVLDFGKYKESRRIADIALGLAEV